MEDNCFYIWEGKEGRGVSRILIVFVKFCFLKRKRFEYGKYLNLLYLYCGYIV